MHQCRLFLLRTPFTSDKHRDNLIKSVNGPYRGKGSCHHSSVWFYLVQQFRLCMASSNHLQISPSRLRDISSDTWHSPLLKPCMKWKSDELILSVRKIPLEPLPSFSVPATTPALANQHSARLLNVVYQLNAATESWMKSSSKSSSIAAAFSWTTFGSLNFLWASSIPHPTLLCPFVYFDFFWVSWVTRLPLVLPAPKLQSASEFGSYCCIVLPCVHLYLPRLRAYIVHGVWWRLLAYWRDWMSPDAQLSS